MRERHSALLLNIGTYAKEDEVYELLNILSMSLPFIIMVTWVLDAVLAAIYLKYLHPWRIILQKVSCSICVSASLFPPFYTLLGTRFVEPRGS